MPLDEKSFVPLYYQLTEELRENIENGEWPPNSLIPSETELCEKYKVSRGTVRQALSQLVQEGLLYRKQGKGTFVAEPKITQQLNRFYSFAQDMREKGLRPSSLLLQKEKILPDSYIKNILGLKEEEMVYKIMRLRLADEEPLILETSYLVEELFPDLDKEDVEKVPLYDIILKKYRIKITRAKETFEPILIDEFEAKKLKIPVGSPALLVKRITYTAGIPFEFRKSVVRGDKCSYSVELI
ncbi:MAG TPA: GntR family transcriptional regulator [Candidatus Aerophobetes bacterium]|uniref:GntR family transcriptional regulator n=1 Tax=Aerophobetes bacterium TaxID=2030807 RepID=A0A7V0N0S4_UNCAE|nr:GntR family transcriptional regulator [Candidatus Aerophobetes bacterium]